jgi:putative DNA primase/helicase
MIAVGKLPERTLPHDRQSELALLCAALLDSAGVLAETRAVSPEAFYDHRAQALWRIMQRLHAAGTVVDLTTIEAAITDPREAEELPGFLSEVVSAQSGLPAAAASYANAILENHRRRELIELAHHLDTGAFDKAVDVDLVERETLRQLTAITQAQPAAESPAPLSAAIVTSAELATLAVVPRRFIVRPFFREGDLGFIYAKRGDGKTWLAMLLAKAAATGGTAGPWTADGVWPVLYVDGEMPAEESKRRDSVLSGASENLAWIHHEIFFDRTGKTLNLTSLATQAELTALLVERRFKVLVLDNLSCLFSGVKENDADAWELVLPWLLELRRRKIAVVIVAHAGRNGLMRGTSRREDAAFWVLKLERQDPDDPLFRGLRFTSLFTKNRNALEDDCPPLEWTVAADGNGPATVTAKTISGVELLVSWVRAGLDSASDIALEMGISKGQVSKLAKRAERLGSLVIEGRRYRPTVDT